mgnify:CR=1 FL=1
MVSVTFCAEAEQGERGERSGGQGKSEHGGGGGDGGRDRSIRLIEVDRKMEIER